MLNEASLSEERQKPQLDEHISDPETGFASAGNDLKDTFTLSIVCILIEKCSRNKTLSGQEGQQKKSISVAAKEEKASKTAFCCCHAPPTEGSVSLRERYSSSPLCPSPPPPLVCMMMFREIITEISLRRWRHCYYMLPGVLGWVETQKTKR